jgi:hypothetical protein
VADFRRYRWATAAQWLALCTEEAKVLSVMSAAEIIEMIKKLPPDEKAEVIAFAQKEAESDTPRFKFISEGEFEKWAPAIFEKNRALLRRLAQ